MGQGSQILWPHNSPSKSYCPVPWPGRRILMLSGLCHGRLSLVPLWAPRPLCLPKARSWRFGVRGALSLIPLWDDTDCFGIWSVHSMAPLWSSVNLAVEGSLGNWAEFILLGIPSLSFVCGKFLIFRLLYKASWEDYFPQLWALESCRSFKFFPLSWTKNAACIMGVTVEEKETEAKNLPILQPNKKENSSPSTRNHS